MLSNENRLLVCAREEVHVSSRRWEDVTWKVLYASKVLAYYSKISTNAVGDFTENQMLVADVNGDGIVDAVDASNILSYYAYISTSKEDIMSIKDFMKKK